MNNNHNENNNNNRTQVEELKTSQVINIWATDF